MIGSTVPPIVVESSDQSIESAILIVSASTLMGWLLHTLFAAFIAWKVHEYRIKIAEELEGLREDIKSLLPEKKLEK